MDEWMDGQLEWKAPAAAWLSPGFAVRGPESGRAVKG